MSFISSKETKFTHVKIPNVMNEKITNNFKELFKEEEGRFAARQSYETNNTREGPSLENETSSCILDVSSSEQQGTDTKNGLCCISLAHKLESLE